MTKSLKEKREEYLEKAKQIKEQIKEEEKKKFNKIKSNFNTDIRYLKIYNLCLEVPENHYYFTGVLKESIENNFSNREKYIDIGKKLEVERKVINLSKNKKIKEEKNE